MGGDYYDRDVVQTTSTTGYSADTNKVVGVTSQLHLSMNPTRWKDNPMPCDALNPIIFALDVTGSMGDWSKIIYEKMPMFYGQIMMQKYLEEPSISFCAVGDHTCDGAPLQVSEFGQGKEIDQLIGKMYLEGGGGGNDHESYEMSAYFYNYHVDLTNNALPFFFLTGDEGFWETIEPSTVKSVIGAEINQKMTGKACWKELCSKYNVFFVKKVHQQSTEKKIFAQWTEAIGEERILYIKTPKACIDVILGAIAITSGVRDFKGYVKDMRSRGQDEARITEVTNALKMYNNLLEQGKVKIIRGPAYKGQTGSSTNSQSGSNSETQQLCELVEKLILNENLDDESITMFKKLRHLNKNYHSKVNQDLICPLTKEIFFEPYMTVDGHTFEKKAIEEWLKKHDTSPVTHLKLDSNILIPNQMAKKMVHEFYESHKNLF